MRLWRISNYVDLAGTGGLLEAARWHLRGHKIVYLAENPASALLEVLVHMDTDPSEIPTRDQLIAVDVPDHLAFETIEASDLPPDWRDDLSLTRNLGSEWLIANKTPLVRVPSAIVPYTTNWLLNPAHPEAMLCAIAMVTREAFDRRLFQ